MKSRLFLLAFLLCAFAPLREVFAAQLIRDGKLQTDLNANTNRITNATDVVTASGVSLTNLAANLGGGSGTLYRVESQVSGLGFTTPNGPTAFLTGTVATAGSFADTNSVGVIATNAVNQSTNVAARLASNVWATAGSTTNYALRRDGRAAPIYGIGNVFSDGGHAAINDMNTRLDLRSTNKSFAVLGLYQTATNLNTDWPPALDLWNYGSTVTGVIPENIRSGKLLLGVHTAEGTWGPQLYGLWGGASNDGFGMVTAFADSFGLPQERTRVTWQGLTVSGAVTAVGFSSTNVVAKTGGTMSGNLFVESSAGGIQFSGASAGGFATFYDNSLAAVSLSMQSGGGGLRRDGSKIWDAANDGSGSGLDADLLDGLNSSAFFQSIATNGSGNVVTNLTFGGSVITQQMGTVTGGDGAAAISNAFVHFNLGAARNATNNGMGLARGYLDTDTATNDIFPAFFVTVSSNVVQDAYAKAWVRWPVANPTQIQLRVWYQGNTNNPLEARFSNGTNAVAYVLGAASADALNTITLTPSGFLTNVAENAAVQLRISAAFASTSSVPMGRGIEEGLWVRR